MRFTVDEVHLFLSETLDLSMETLDSFVSNRIDGGSFLELRDAELAELITPLGDRKKIQKLLSSYAPAKTVSIAQHRHKKQIWIGATLDMYLLRNMHRAKYVYYFESCTFPLYSPCSYTYAFNSVL